MNLLTVTPSELQTSSPLMMSRQGTFSQRFRADRPLQYLSSHLDSDHGRS